MKFLSVLALGAAMTAPTWAQTAGTVGPDVPAFTVRTGYRVSLAAKDFGEARLMQFDDKGNLYVSQPGSGTIATLRLKKDSQKKAVNASNGTTRLHGKVQRSATALTVDGLTYEKVADFTTGKPRVHGLDFKNGWLWFTQSGDVWKARDTNGDGKADEEIHVLKDLPEGGGHWWRSILVGDDGFYTSIGDPQNLSLPEDTGIDRQKIWKYSLDGSTRTLWCEGIRNTEKLRFRPGTTEIYGADHGSDNFGANLHESKGNQPVTDRIPPCEFNFYEQGKFYGHPFIVGNGMPRPEYADRPDILAIAAKTTLPAWQFGAHWAPNGWTFMAGDGLKARGDAFIALHGSWNSTAHVGYRIEHILFDPATGKPMGSQLLVSELAPDGTVLGRPTDCVEAPDGSLLFSDDQNQRIYRVVLDQ